jgi:hypothetical protein
MLASGRQDCSCRPDTWLAPKLDMEPTYNAAAAYAIELGRTKEACLADQNAEESTLAEARFRIEYDDSDID